MKQEDLAAVIGLSRSTIAGIESGKDRGGIQSMIAIADYFQVPMDWLLGRETPSTNPDGGQFIDIPDEIAWIDFWRKMSIEDRRAVIRFLRIPGMLAGKREPHD